MRSLFLSFSFFLSIYAIGQVTAHIIPPYSHNLIISDICFSDDDEHIFSLGLDGSMILWDSRTQTPIKKIIAHERECYTLSLSNNGDKLLTSSMDSTLKIWDAKTLDLIHIIRTKDANLTAEWSHDDSLIISGGNSGIVQIYESKKYKFLEGYVAGESPVYDAQFFRGKKMIITGNQGGHVKLTLRGTGKIGMDLDIEVPVHKIVMDESQSFFAVHATNGQVDIVTVPDMQPYGSLKLPKTTLLGKFEFVSEIDINSRNKLMAYADNAGGINISDPMTKKMQTVRTSHEGFISKVKFSKSGKWLASVDHNQKIYVYDLKNFDVNTSTYISIKKFLPASDYPNKLYFLEDNSISFTGMQGYNWNMETGAMDEISLTENFNTYSTHFHSLKYEDFDYRYNDHNGIVLAISSSDTTVIINEFKAVSQNAKHILFNHNKSWIYINAKTKTLRSIKIKKDADLIDEMALSNKGVFYYTEGRKINQLNLSTEESTDYKVEEKISHISTYKSNTLFCTFEHEFYLLNNGKISVQQIENEQGYKAGLVSKDIGCFFGTDKKLRFINIFSGKIQSTQKIDVTGIISIEKNEFNNFMAIVTTDRSIELGEYQNNKFERLYQIFGLGKSGMMISTNEGFYMGTKNAYRELSFLYKNNVHALEQFDGILNQPYEVLKLSPVLDPESLKLLKLASSKRSKKVKINSISNLDDLPKISIDQKHQYSSVTLKEKLNISFTFEKTEFPIIKYQIYLNDVPYYGMNGKSTSSTTNRETILLIPGKNKISCVAIDDQGQESLKDEIEIIYDIKDEPTLYMISIGVSDYSNSDFNLNYASKDASDISQLMSDSKAFKQVKSKTILDKNVSKSSLKQIKTFLKYAKHSDVVIIFMAGHGTLDASYDYYFAGHDMDFKAPSSNGISFNEIQEMLDQLPCLRKILLMDTCHSGEVDKEDVTTVSSNQEEDSDLTFRSSGNAIIASSTEKKVISKMASNMFIDTRNSTGATIISSSGGTEVAREGKEWKNGLFTYCFKLGIESKQADLNRDGKIMLSELRTFINDRVSSLSHGLQQPTARSLNLSMDYQIY